MKIHFLFFCFISAFCNAQNQYPFFPKDQHCYLGSFPEFYKDFHQILNENQLKPCENKKEFFTASVLIKTDNTAEILENKTSQENKCSFELSKEVMKHMDKWIPAKIDGKETATIARILIYMDDLFENYKNGYTIKNVMTKSDFDVQEFRSEVVKKVDMDDFTFKGKGNLKIKTKFAINEQGELDKLEMIESSGLKEFDEMILRAIKRTLKNRKWTPAKIHDVPIKSTFILPFSIKI